MDFVSIIIPTYNRLDELVITLPQIVKCMDENSELIIFDQSDKYAPIEHVDELTNLLDGVNVKYYHCSVPSVTLAWNTAAKLAKGTLILFLDDDINIDINIVEAHRKYYENNTNVFGVAGGYYASRYDRVWVPSSRKGVATTLAGVNTSFRKEAFLHSGGCATSFIKPFAGFDWELAEHVNQGRGKISVGDDALVFHRAPASGGCENQKERGVEWYYGCYHNHMLWMLHRRFPQCLTQLPRHFYSLIRYCLPKRQLFFSYHFFRDSIFKGIVDAFKIYRSQGRIRVTDSLSLGNELTCIIDLKKKDGL